MPLVWQLWPTRKKRALRSRNTLIIASMDILVEMAFKQWEAMQNVGSPQKTSEHQ